MSKSGVSAIRGCSRGEDAPEVFAREFEALSAAVHDIVETDPLGVGFFALRAECSISLSSQNGRAIDKQLALAKHDTDTADPIYEGISRRL